MIERFTGSPVDSLAGLVVESERLGFRFVRRLADEWISGANRFDRPGEVLFLARAGDEVVGVCGLNLDPYAADPRVGRCGTSTCWCGIGESGSASIWSRT